MIGRWDNIEVSYLCRILRVLHSKHYEQSHIGFAKTDG
jgi:hypothetical protein